MAISWFAFVVEGSNFSSCGRDPLPLSGDGGSLPECYVLRNEAAVLGTTRNLEQHMVPLFIANGEIIRDDTAGKKYLGKETSGE